MEDGSDGVRRGTPSAARICLNQQVKGREWSCFFSKPEKAPWLAALLGFQRGHGGFQWCQDEEWLQFLPTAFPLDSGRGLCAVGQAHDIDHLPLD